MGRHQRAESTGLVSSLLCAMAAAVIMGLYIRYAPPIWQVTRRLFPVASTLAAARGVCCFIFGYARRSRSFTLRRGWWVPVRRALEILALATVYASTIFLTTYAAFGIINDMMGVKIFEGYFIWAAIGFPAVTGYIAYVQAELMDAKTLASLLPLFVVAGVTTAGLTTDDPYWWHNNFSQLGDSTTFAARMFNATLILAGLAVIIISYFAVSELTALHRLHEGITDTPIADDHTKETDSKSQDDDPPAAIALSEDAPVRLRHLRRLLRALEHFLSDFQTQVTCLMVMLTFAGIAFIGIGAFRYTPFPILHNLFARGLPVMMTVLMIGLPWLAPELSRAMYAASYLMIALCGLVGLSWLLNRNTLTNVEAFSGLMFLGWFIVFSRQIAAIEADRINAQLKIIATKRQPARVRRIRPIESRLAADR